MYDRATRFQSGSTSTPSNVGPGSYDAGTSTGFIKAREVDGFAPFQSMATRETFLDISEQVVSAPGPGQYDPGLSGRIKGGSTIANRGGRFDSFSNETPGPGSYNLSKRSDWLRNKGKQKVEDAPAAYQSGYHVAFRRKPDPPSIPSPGQAFGYEEGMDGSLQKQRAPEHDNSLGPAYYHINEDETAPVQKYRGTHFGKLTSQRTDFKGEEGPGPGSYDPFKGKEKAPIDIIIEEQRKKTLDSDVPRYHELVTIVEEKKAVPGPGKYNIKSQFDRQAPNAEATTRPSFGSQDRRFRDSADHFPAPGSYNDPRHSLEVINRTTGLKRTPFGQTATRFVREHHVTRTPGPGSYNHQDLASNVRKKALFNSSRKGGFGSTASRSLPLNKKDEHSLPGPGHYVAPKSAPTGVRGVSKKHAVFASTTARLALPSRELTIPQTNPPPGSYEVGKSHDKTQGRVLYNDFQSNSKKHAGFLSSTKRFSQPRDIILHKTSLANPGPGEYNVKNPEIPGGNLVTRERRFKAIKNEVPGPGNYDLHPLLESSVLGSTFNTSLDISDILKKFNDDSKNRKTYHPHSFSVSG